MRNCSCVAWPWLLGILLLLATVAASPLEETAQERGAAAASQRDTPWFRAEDSPARLIEALGEDHASERWIYHDLDAARHKSRETGKPLLVFFRCVPCGVVQDFDRQIASADSPLAALLDQFVCVRMVKMNGVNRNLFRFDPDVPHIGMFLNADGTVYGRYGRRSSDGNQLSGFTLASFRTALERVLQLHADYPANQQALAGKRAAPESPAWPEDMPAMEPSPSNPEEVRNCIHCHMVGEARMAQATADRTLTLQEIWPYPQAESIGLRLIAEDGLRVSDVIGGSPAERAGLRVGDELLACDGQPLVSVADLQWVLHHLPHEAQPKIEVMRGGQAIESTLELCGLWRKSPTHWRDSLKPLRPGIALLPDSQKHKKGIASDVMALVVRWSRGRAAEAGLRSGDLLIAVDGRTDLHTDADFLRYIHIERPEAKTIEATVLRKGETLKVRLPIR